MKILIVDDERVIVKGLRFNLENEGYQVVAGCNGQQAVELARQERPDLILMDVMMPGMSGMDACIQIREFSDVPIIMLTAKGEDMDKIMGFECGADDYVTKPFNVLELKARVKALLRRSSANGAGARGRYRDPEDTITAGHILLDRVSRDVQREGISVELTAKEFDLLELLMSHPGRVFSREKLLDQVWGYEYQGDYRTVDVHIRRLREKVELVPASPQYILTKWGVGYYFAANK
ncbi:MAG: response regulator transcription factor [Clostridiales bacterium]|nr:response regulator transcription factor [Clostridiales bacterium]